MSTSDTEMERLIRGRAREARERERKRLQELELEQEQHRQKITLQSQKMSVDMPKLVADFKEKFNKEPNRDGSLGFSSHESATEFLKGQATATSPREFHLAKLDQNGKPTNYHMYSCGSGHLFQGTLEEIKTQIKEALATATGDKTKLKEGQAYIDSWLATKSQEATSGMRQNMNNLRNPEESSTPSDSRQRGLST